MRISHSQGLGSVNLGEEPKKKCPEKLTVLNELVMHVGRIYDCNKLQVCPR